jgi:hypothetical protein
MAQAKFVKRIAKERNCAPELVRAIVTDCLTSLNETAFKEGMGAALVSAYWELGPESAYHLCSLLEQASHEGPGYWNEHYKRLDPTMARFRTIIDRWEFEMRGPSRAD